MNFIVFILLIGAVYANLWGSHLDEFIPYFAISFLCWTFISNCFLEASSYHKTNESYLVGMAKYSILSDCSRILVRNSLLTAHNLPFIFVINFVFPTLEIPSIINIVSLLVGLLIMFAVMLFISGLSAWFKDFAQILPLILQLFFFATPIFWKAELLEGRRLALDLLINYNPIYNLLIFFRGGFLGESIGNVALYHYPIVLMMAISGLFMQFTRARLNF